MKETVAMQIGRDDYKAYKALQDSCGPSDFLRLHFQKSQRTLPNGWKVGLKKKC